MKQDLDLKKLIESAGFEVVDVRHKTIVFVVTSPNDTLEQDEYNSFRDMLNELMQTDVGVQLKAEFNEEWEGRPSRHGEDLEDYAFDNIERVAIELNYKIERVVK